MVLLYIYFSLGPACYAYFLPIIYVTGFMKTGPNRTRTEIHFIA